MLSALSLIAKWPLDQRLTGKVHGFIRIKMWMIFVARSDSQMNLVPLNRAPCLSKRPISQLSQHREECLNGLYYLQEDVGQWQQRRE
jgi:hypothetical protein